MRFKQYLTEGIKSKKEILALIEKDCKPFLAGWRKLKIDEFLLSGRQSKTFFAKKQVRKNREPVDTPLDIHKLLDDWFYKKFGVRSRSNAVFCSFDEKIANFYGKPFLVFPISKYKAVSSKIVEDLFDLFYSDTDDIENEYSEHNGEIIKLLEKGKYTAKLTYHKNEIMVTCKEYYIVDYSLTDYLLENLKR